MLANSTLPDGPLYDPKSKVQKFRFEEDFENIRFNLLGTTALYSDPKFYYYLGSDKEWRRPKEIAVRPHFIKGKPNRFDALQGKMGDCWVVAAMEVLTLNDNLIKHVVPPDQSFEQDYIGAFHFRLWHLGNWYDVVVDDRLPVWKKDKKLCNVRSKTADVFWAALLEKAYAKFCGDTYDNLDLGYSIKALQDFSGGIVEMVLTDELPRQEVKWFLNNIITNGALMCCACFDDITDLTTDLVPLHSYSVTKVFQSPQDDGLFLIRIMNPYGHKEWKGDWSDESYKWREIYLAIRKKLDVKRQDDGEFWMDDKDFDIYFKMMHICHLGPGQYEQSRRGENVNIWKTTSFFGEWKKKISSGGANIAYRHLNPQYRIILGKNDTQDGGMCSVVIELTQRDKFERRRIHQIGVYVYSLENITPPPPMPLDFIFFNMNKALNDREVTFSMKYHRSFVTRMKLDPGKYCLVPCTKEINVELQYLLRVYTESRVEMWEYDPTVTKSKPPLEEESLDETDIQVNNMFQEVADTQDEIDWITLKEILDKAMSDKSSFSIFTRISKLVRNVFETFMTSSNLNESDDLLFSKDDCRSMILMLDDNHNGKLSYSEFSNLWGKISFWTKVYKRHVGDTEGRMAVSELRDALSSVGYNVNLPVLHILINFYANEQEVSLKDFILCGVRLEAVMSLYHKNYTESKGEKITFTLEEWVRNTLCL